MSPRPRGRAPADGASFCSLSRVMVSPECVEALVHLGCAWAAAYGGPANARSAAQGVLRNATELGARHAWLPPWQRTVQLPRLRILVAVREALHALAVDQGLGGIADAAGQVLEAEAIEAWARWREVHSAL